LRLGDDLQVVLKGEQQRQGVAHRPLVFGDHDFDQGYV
jgi:hypothetical protein